MTAKVAILPSGSIVLAQAVLVWPVLIPLLALLCHPPWVQVIEIFPFSIWRRTKRRGPKSLRLISIYSKIGPNLVLGERRVCIT